MFNYVLLFEKQNDKSNLIAQYPPKIDVPDSALISRLCIPSTLYHSKTEVFAFNTQSNYCFSYAFIFQNTPYSITIVSATLYASLYFDFLHAVDGSFLETNEKSDPMCRFGLVKSLILSWATDNNNDLIVNFPFDSFALNLLTVSSWFVNFNVAPLSPYFMEVWYAALMNEGVLIIAPTAEIASSAVFGILSMLDRLKYFDKILLYTEKCDPRYKEILEHDLPYKIVGTTDPNLANGASHFSAIITIRANHFDNMFDQQHEFRTKTIRLFGYFLIQMNMQLMTDPYSDMLNKEVNVEELLKICNGEYPGEVFQKVQKTETFMKWRKHVSDREQLRDAFLSVPPKEAIKVIKPEFYELALEQLRIISNTYVRDQHFQSVLKQHIHLITKKLKKKSADKS
ncbi:hypothetical protein TRFO_11280 [Tritrichomonas foetus]|uniref:AVL9/DENND6 domain-containing protein n=1 Tax=Tritrichomonas foetus TaxID=1144522 RepID=A0A1J4J9T9_9EUKA|nr:hypothetical protein TRFO_11280 [Tritrichomonas foetus]|eukprot:OHS94205.1 hypothetical protein TRFO_11280 [Tritrichomonas foetus]